MNINKRAPFTTRTHTHITIFFYTLCRVRTHVTHTMAATTTDAQQQELLKTFKEITHETDDVKCTRTLTVYNWDLASAIDGFLAGGHANPVMLADEMMHAQALDEEGLVEGGMEGYAGAINRQGGGRTSGAGSAALGNPWGTARVQGLRNRMGARPTGQARGANGDPRNGRGRGAEPQGWVSWAISLIFSPIQTFLSAVDYILGPVLRAITAVSGSFVQSDFGKSEETVIREFETEYDQKYGTRHASFFHGSFSQAVSLAKERLQYVVVYVHSPRHLDTDIFCREFMSNQTVMDLCQQDSVFFAASASSTLGWGTANALQATGYPFVAVVLPIGSKIKLVGKIEDISTVSNFTEQLKGFTEMANAELMLQRNERLERLNTRNLLREQEQAFQESLRADQEKAEQKRTAEEKEREEEERKQREIDEEERVAQELEDLREKNFKALPAEPETGQTETANIVFRLPLGGRLQRRFNLDDSVKHVYDFVAGHHLDHDIPDDFSLVCSFPRTEYTDHSLTLRAAKLTGSVALMVQDLD
ncbi:hypothetical protein SARC_05756 [Sphaeroforma arctica JP610]|uniref:UBX domain-containing protein n=1 Tax=Sphaeroforma arctica JP610 TaxID=667725 RepID=A0A0L0FYL8_9EUKA|nr:hypothetical protein SARC_05756 [Sphaeroforma arctica JP610]KNC81942.1 hypothetical protein SARC_05756 [Sphaeroforma arctica JP610]|eukprot:XP_014155844.1 hypothetical protein SARC_05756 [Sphaeroforma arctica JP610]